MQLRNQLKFWNSEKLFWIDQLLEELLTEFLQKNAEIEWKK